MLCLTWETPLTSCSIDDPLSAPSGWPDMRGGSAPPVPDGVTQLLQRWSQGDSGALDRVLPMVYGELRQLAYRHLRQERASHTLQGTGLVHEAYLRIAQRAPLRWESRAHFFGWASALMRHILVDHARARQADKRGGGMTVLSLEAMEETGAAGVGASASQADDTLDLVALDRALQRLEKLDAQQSRVVELRFFGGLSVLETAQTLHISPATVKREWATARAWLLREIGRASSAS